MNPRYLPPADIDPVALLRPRRKITGFSAVLLPFTGAGDVDWDGFIAHLSRTAAAGLVPAINMDTGYVHLLDASLRRAVLGRTQAALAGRPFASGAFVGDRPGAPWDPAASLREIEAIRLHGGTPVIFQSYGLAGLPAQELLSAYTELGRLGPFIAFELSPVFAPFGKIYDLETFAGLLELPTCLGLKHSSLSRFQEWQRLALRDRMRPDFKLFTGNDLAIDMVMYGSDYLLGLSTFAPDLFARRDALWQAGDPDFYELNDRLQYLGCFAFRPPVPAYRHSAAQFLKLRGWIASASPHPAASRRSATDLPILQAILDSFQPYLEAGSD